MGAHMQTTDQPTYPIAPHGIFPTIQGEGVLLGTPMVFIRLAGCSVGCPQCDTDYSVSDRLTLPALMDKMARVSWGSVDWAWITGGEPTDHDLAPLVNALHERGFKVAIATAGVREVASGLAWGGVDFLSVSPHDPARWMVRRGDQLNLVPGLNGLSLTDPTLLAILADKEVYFSHRYVTPLWGDPASLEACRWWVQCRRGWKLGVQAHKAGAGWGVP